MSLTIKSRLIGALAALGVGMGAIGASGWISTAIGNQPPPEGRWTQGTSLDGKGQFSVFVNEPLGQVPTLGAPRPEGYAQAEQLTGDGQGLVGKMAEKVKGALSHE